MLRCYLEKVPGDVEQKKSSRQEFGPEAENSNEWEALKRMGTSDCGWGSR